VTRPPVDLDAVTEGWRSALDAADDALSAVDRAGMSRIPDVELRRQRLELARQRAAAATLLDTIAGEQHLHLRRPLSAPRATKRMLGLPLRTAACVFDLDGVLTASAALHAAAWAETFDPFLGRRGEHVGEAFVHLARPFDPRADYLTFLHGRPRLVGVRDFLASRGIRLADGRPDDAPTSETVHGLANRKSEAVRRILAREGVAAYAGSRAYLDAAREAGVRSAVVSASAHTREILERARLVALVEVRVDGETIRRDHLQGKPAPDTLLAACRMLGLGPGEAAAFETTIEGIAAARQAGVGLVVAVDRTGAAIAWREAGADLVVHDLAELLDPVLVP
jgi:HAD superfamily hydrolase (TIGR01509 family)